MECAQCKKPIGSSPKVTSGEENFHADCFKCHECKKNLVGVSYYTVNENKVCKDCYATKIAPKCSACSKNIVGQSTKLGDGRTFHPECFVCCKCEKPIETSFKTNDDGKFEHTPNCENTTASDKDQCIDCEKRLINIKYFTLAGGDKACADCYAAKHSESCYVCKKPILEGQIHIVKDWRYHDKCFVCPKRDCGKHLAGRKTQLEGSNVVCMNCKAVN